MSPPKNHTMNRSTPLVGSARLTFRMRTQGPKLCFVIGTVSLIGQKSTRYAYLTNGSCRETGCTSGDFFSIRKRDILLVTYVSLFYVIVRIVALASLNVSCSANVDRVRR